MTPAPELVATFWPVALRIANSMARRMKGYWSQEELASFGYDGIIGGLRTYDPSYGRSLEDHIARRIKGAMLDGMSIKRWHFIPRSARMADCFISDSDIATRQAEQDDDIDAALACLSRKQSWIIRAYYLKGWSQERIGKALGISASAVSQNLKRSLRYIREACAQSK